MKEFVEKLIEILKERKNHYSDEAEKLNNFPQMQHCRRLQMRSYETSIKIVNNLAEEYKDKYVSVETLKQVMWERDVAIEQLKELGYGFGEKVGWIPCSERLPETCEDVWCTVHLEGSAIVSAVVLWYNPRTRKWFGTDDESVCDKLVVDAWMPLPPNYQPEAYKEGGK